MREQSKRLFYISRKLASDDFKQVVSGLQESRIFVNEVRTIDFLNTIVMCIIDLFNTAKFAYIKAQCAAILHSCKQFISQLPSKPQIISTLSKCLKSSDAVIRILSLEIIISLKQLFIKDSSVYHLMCSRLKWKQQMSKKQQLRTIQCLEMLLSNSEYLAQMFSNNITELYELGGIEVKIIVYLCGKAKFEHEAYCRIVKEVMKICKVNSSSTSINKIIGFYLSRLVVKASRKNYLCLQIYKSELCAVLPGIRQQMSRIEESQYNFMHNCKQGAQMWSNRQVLQKWSNQKLFDMCYEYVEVQNQLSLQLQSEIRNRILESKTNSKCEIDQCLLMMTMLMSKASREQYQLQNVFIEKYQKILNNYNMHNAAKNSAIRLLKISLATCNYRLASLIINYCLNSDTCMNRYANALLVFQIYTHFHIHNDSNSNSNSNGNLHALIIMLQNIAMSSKQPFLLALSKQWKRIYITQNNSNDSKSQNSTHINIDQYDLLQQQAQQLSAAIEQSHNNLININTHNSKQYQPLHSRIIKCQQQLQNCRNQRLPLLPVCLSEYKSGIHFGKKTIIDIFNYL